MSDLIDERLFDTYDEIREIFNLPELSREQDNYGFIREQLDSLGIEIEATVREMSIPSDFENLINELGGLSAEIPIMNENTTTLQLDESNRNRNNNNTENIGNVVFDMTFRNGVYNFRTNTSDREDLNEIVNMLRSLIGESVNQLAEEINLEALEDVKITLSKDIIKKIPLINFDSTIEDQNFSCSICLGDFEEDEQLRILQCEHLFHPDCIDNWLMNYKVTCPMCRNDTRNSK